MKLSELLNKLKNKEPIIFHTRDDTLQINSQYKNNTIFGYEIILRITNICNQNCEFCFNNKTREIDQKKLNIIINNLSKLNLENSTINISGGEPSTHKNLQKIINILSKTNAKIKIQTNATIIDYIQEIKYKNIDFFISLPSINENIFNKITKSSNYNNAINGIKEISTKFKTTINFVTYKTNYKDIPEIINFIENNLNKKNITLLISNLGLTNKFYYKDKLIEYQKIMNFIKLSVNNTKIKIKFTISGGCGFPICVLFYNNIKLEKELFKADNSIISFNNLSKQFYKNNECINCVYNDFCQGFLKEYILLFGDKEIKTIKI